MTTAQPVPADSSVASTTATATAMTTTPTAMTTTTTPTPTPTPTTSEALPTAVILRVEIPSLGLRKAIRVQRSELVKNIIQQIVEKSNLDMAAFDNYKLFLPAAVGASMGGGGHWLDSDQSLDHSLTWSQHAWRDHDIVQLKDPKESPCIGPDRSFSSASLPCTPRTSFSAGTAVGRPQKSDFASLLKHARMTGGKSSSGGHATTAWRSSPVSRVPSMERVGESTANTLSINARRAMEVGKLNVKKWGNLIAANVGGKNKRSAEFFERTSSSTQKLFGVALDVVDVESGTGLPTVIEQSLRYLEAHGNFFHTHDTLDIS